MGVVPISAGFFRTIKITFPIDSAGEFMSVLLPKFSKSYLEIIFMKKMVFYRVRTGEISLICRYELYNDYSGSVVKVVLASEFSLKPVSFRLSGHSFVPGSSLLLLDIGVHSIG